MKNRKPSQAKQILVQLQAGYSVTPLHALNLFGCMRLSARIYELRAAGHDIKEKRVRVSGGALVSAYYIQDES